LIDRISCEESTFLTVENQELMARNIGYANSEVLKFSFFKEGSIDQINSESFLGYAVVKIDRDSQGQPLWHHVFEAILPPPRTSSQNNFLHCQRPYRVVNTLGNDFVVNGALYAQQNGKSFVCAHVALRTILACILPAGDITYQQISQITGKRSGLGSAEIERVFNALNLPFQKVTYGAHSQNKTVPSRQEPEYMRELYGFIESACPALLGFELTNGQRHIVPVLGHTFNEDSWVPPSNWGYFQLANFRFFSSEQWLSSHLIHDDNFGPYYCLPRQFLTGKNFRLLYGINLQKPPLFSIDAELSAIGFFHQAIQVLRQLPTKDPWLDLFLVFASETRLVLRAVYLTKEKYIEHLRNCAHGEVEDTIHVIEKVLPDSFWMVEASMPELFSVSRRKFGEVILFPYGDDVEFDPCSFICMRLPNYILLRDADDCLKWFFHTSPIMGHTPIYSDT
jgi:hypothetical protein